MRSWLASGALALQQLRETEPRIDAGRAESAGSRLTTKMFARKLQGKPGPDEKAELEHHIRTEEDTIRKYETDLARRGG
jgi:hypothetical protein